MLLRWLRTKKQTIKPVSHPAEPVTPIASTLHDRLLQAVSLCDIDTLIKNPVAAMSLLTVYSSSCHELIQETLIPSRTRVLVGISLYGFFKDSHLPPSLVMERLASLFEVEPASNYARFDIENLITELHDLSRVSSRLL